MKKKKKLTAIGFVKIIKQSFGDNMFFSDGFEGVLNFIAMSMRVRAMGKDIEGTCIAENYTRAANKIHEALDKRGYYND